MQRNYILRHIVLAVLTIIVGAGAMAQRHNWRNVMSTNDPEFFKTDEARRVGDQILDYQRNTGGWPKNTDMVSPMTPEQREKVLADKERTDDSTIDNRATTREMTYLARLWQATGDERYRQGFMRGLEYLLSGQYPDGGWPQFWPNPHGYQQHITYNDNAIINTLTLFRKCVQGESPYRGIIDAATKERLQQAMDRALSVILKTQIVVDGVPTVWCQQHDRSTYAPAKARAYELPSYCSMESANIVEYLMDLPNPSDSVINAVVSAMNWLDAHKITGYKVVRDLDENHRVVNTRLVEDANTDPIWARYYSLADGQPYVCDRDGVPRKNLEDIGVERRNGYGWYNSTVLEILPKYRKWCEKYVYWNEDSYRSIEAMIKAPTFNKRSVKITKYGASPDKSAADNQRAINKAIAEISRKGGGHVIVPAGTYTTGAITMQSNVNLVVEKDATLLFAFEPELYPVVPTRWEGLDCWNLQPCIYAYQAKNIAITGEGTIDGGGSNETWWKWCGAPHYGWKEGVISQRNGARARLLKYAEDGVDMDERRFGPADGLRPQLINFNQCENILIEDVTLLRSPFWVIHPLLSRNITVRGVTIDNDGPNGDGCDPESCDGVLIENCLFNTGDDCIAVKSGRNNDGRVWDLPSRNIIIRGCTMANGHGGVVIGSEITGGCNNLFAEDCKMDSPELERVVRIKTNTCRGGVIENIYARNITVGQCKEAVLKINLDYEHNELCCRGFLPTVRNVSIDNITCQKSKYGVDIIALDTCVNVYNINVVNCRFDGVADGNYRTGLVRDINFDNYYVNGKLCDVASIDDAHMPIDRQRVVTRNNPRVTSADPLSSLSVGNGHFATTVDVTGLQSYPAFYSQGVPLDAMSDWGWHSFANTDSLTPDETRKAYNLHGRSSVYAVEYKVDGRNKEATEYYRVNPHRLSLGTVGLQLTGADGKVVPIEQLTDINQELKLWDGLIESKFTADGKPVEVTTGVLGNKDCLFSRIVTPLFDQGQAAVTFSFAYPTGKHADDANDWNSPDKHQTEIIASDDRSVTLRRTLGDTVYYALIEWEGDAVFTEQSKHMFTLTPTEGDMLNFAIEYTPTMPVKSETRYAYDQARKAVMKTWPAFWRKGGIVDFGACTDKRAPELERRVILSQYLTKINCDNQTPPQETGLTYNSWFGRPHLEMTWWHAVDFALWGRPEMVENMLAWYTDTAYDEAKAIAERQGFKGVRWMKMTDPEAGEAPSNTGSFLTWQQPHYIYMAEEVYRAKPTAATLKRYGKCVEETAEFMADFAKACAPAKRKAGAKEGDIKLYGQTAMQESMSKDFSYWHPFEQAYWYYGLSTAQKWRERQGLERNAEWDEIISRLAPLAGNDSIYTAGVPIKPFTGKKAKGAVSNFDPYKTPELQSRAAISEEEFLLKSRSDHPAVLGACGLLPETPLYDKEKMTATLDWVMDNWNWDTTWGWDYGMIAMSAARLGRPETALQALLIDKGKNTYLVSGHNYQEPKRLRLYLPGNGSLLDAVAMMCAGWDGSEGTNPGFPQDGTWQVRWEGLKPMQ